MSSVVHFKFRSSLKFDSIRFNGHEISVQELKEEIVKSKKFDKFMEQFDLVITNDQTKIEYKPDDFVPKNSSVIVARLPIIRPKRDLQKKAVSPPVQTAENDSTLECISKMTDVASMNLSEEDKLITVMDQGNREFDNVNYNKLKKVPRGPVPKNYICHRCGMPGHFIQKCPRARDATTTESFPKLKRSTGIPISFMTTVDDINTPGVLLTSCGRLAVPIIDAEAYRIGKKEKPLFVKSDTPEKDEKEEIPKELTCPVCKDLLTDAVVLPCCGDSACDSCVMTELLQSTSPKCPVCKKSGVSPLGVIPNKFMRTAVFNYKNETGYTAMSRKDATTNSDIPIKAEPEMEKKPMLVNVNLKPESNIKVEPLPEDKPIQPMESLVHTSEILRHESKPQPEVQEILSTSSQLPIGEPVPIPGMKGAKMVRVLVARPGAPCGDQAVSGATFNQMSAMNMYSLPPPPLPHNYHTIITQPGMLQHGASPMPMNQARNSHVLIYPGTIPPRVIGPPPSLVPMGAGAPMQMTYPPRIPGAMPMAMPIPGVGRMPMTEEEFYREKERLRELERKRHQTEGSASPYSPRRDSRPARRKDVFEFAEDIMYKKGPRTRRRSRSRSYLRSRSRSKTRRSSSFTTKSSPSLRDRRHRSRSKMKTYRSSRTPIRKSVSPNRSPPLRKDVPGKMYRESARLSSSPNKPKGRRSITPPRKGERQSRSPKKFFRSSRSVSSQRSFGRPRSRSRSPVRKAYLRDEEPSVNCRSDKMAYKRKSGASSRSPPPPMKRQKDSTDLRGSAYSPYGRVRRSRTPSKRRPFPTSRNHERYIEKSHQEEEDYYRHYKDWHDKDRQDAVRICPRERDFSGSPAQRKRPRSRDSRSRSRESPPFKGERREERMMAREHERMYVRERYEKSDSREQKTDARSTRPDKKDYNCRSKEISRFIESEDVSRSELRKESFKDSRISEDKPTRRDDERKTDYSSKDLHRVDTEKDARSNKGSELRSPPPKSKVQIINPKEAHSSSSEMSQVAKETSVRIVTKDTCKTMKITVSSKWDSDKDHEKRTDRDKSHKADVALDKTSTEECDKTPKHKKKHKKEKKKHAKKHKSKGPE